MGCQTPCKTGKGRIFGGWKGVGDFRCCCAVRCGNEVVGGFLWLWSKDCEGERRSVEGGVRREMLWWWCKS